MLVANSVNRVMPLPGDLRCCPSRAGDSGRVGTAFADFLLSSDVSVAGCRAGRSEIALADQREGDPEPPRRADPSSSSQARSSPARHRPAAAEQPPETATAIEEPVGAPSGEPEKPSSSGTPAANEDSPDPVEEAPAEETAEGEQTVQLPADYPPAIVLDAPVRLQAADLTALPSAANAAPALSVQGEGAGTPPPAPVSASPEVIPPRVATAVSQQADPLVSIAAPVAGLAFPDGSPAGMPAAAPVAMATADALTILPAASAAAGQAQQAAVGSGPASPTVAPFEGAAGAEAGGPVALGAAGDTGEAGDGAGDTGNPG